MEFQEATACFFCRMENLKLRTNLHCDHCVAKVAPLLNEAKEIRDWTIDTEDGVKVLNAVGNGVNAAYIGQLLAQEGYAIIHDTSQPSQAHHFWTDKQAWKRASFNTTNCLIGCSIGDFGMVFYLQAFHPGTPMIWQMILAIIAGLMTSITLETILLKNREKFSWKLALQTAFGMSFISMVGMEIAMTSTDFMFTGGKAAFDQWTYWLALVPALIAGFIAPLPYNYYKLKKFNKSCH